MDVNGEKMKYEELVELVRQAVKKKKVCKDVGHVAFQFNVEGEAEGIFYLEIKDGKINVEPYDYYDRDAIIVTSADVIMQIIEGKIWKGEACKKGLLKVYGDVGLLKVLPIGSSRNNKRTVNKEKN